MTKLFKKILLSVLASVVLVFSMVPAALAQSTTPAPAASTAPGPWYNQNYQQWSTKVFDSSNPNEIFGERYTFAQVNWIINSLTAVIIGSNISGCISGNISNFGGCLQNLHLTSMNAGGIVGLASLSNGILNTKPASGIGFVKDTATKLHVIPQAYAQNGAGFTTLTPIVSLWEVLRDISYALLVVVIIILSFMIMFRVKISPQVVVTIQSALPRIAIALILITFSYAIAGLLVDLSYVFLGIFSVAIKGIGGNRIVMDSITGACGSNASVCLFQQLNSGNGLVSIVVGLIIAPFIMVGVGTTALAIPVIGEFIFGAVGIASIVILIFALIVLFIILRLLWLMIRTACLTVLLIIIGPLMILFGTISNSAGFGRWFRQLAANLSVYPTVAIMIFLSHYFFWGWFMAGTLGNVLGGVFNFLNTYQINNPTNAGGTIIPGLPGNVNLPGVNLSTNIIGLALSFVILFLIPHAAKVIEAMIEGKGFDYGRAVGEATNPLGIRSLITNTAGVYFGNQLYNSRDQSGFIPDTINRFRSGTGKKSQGSGNAGGTPTQIS